MKHPPAKHSFNVVGKMALTLTLTGATVTFACQPCLLQVSRLADMEYMSGAVVVVNMQLACLQGCA